MRKKTEKGQLLSQTKFRLYRNCRIYASRKHGWQIRL